LQQNGIDLQVIGIGNAECAKNFCEFTGLSPSKLSLDPNGDIHKKLNLHAGPNFSIPDSVSDDVLKFFLRQLPGGIPSEESQLRPVARKSVLVLFYYVNLSVRMEVFASRMY